MGIFDKIGTAYKESMDKVNEDRDLPPAVLSEAYEDFILDLPTEVQENIDRLKTIFKNNPQPLINYLDDIKDKGNSDYLDKGVFKEYDILDERDAKRFSDYNYLGKGAYDAHVWTLVSIFYHFLATETCHPSTLSFACSGKEVGIEHR